MVRELLDLVVEDIRAEPWAGVWLLTCVAWAAYAVAFAGC